MNFVVILVEKTGRIKRSVCISKRAFMLKYYPLCQPALCSIFNNIYYANNYAGMFDTGLAGWSSSSRVEQTINLWVFPLENKSIILVKTHAEQYEDNNQARILMIFMIKD